MIESVETLSTAHLGAIAATAIVCALAIAAARRHPGPWVRWSARLLALVLIAAYLTEQITNGLRGEWSVQRSLPLHLTDAVTIVAAAALWSPRPLPFELTYFWGLTASLQAVLTPNLDETFPDIFYWTFFVTHSGSVLAAIFLAWGLDRHPREGAVHRVFAATAAFAALAAATNLATGGNYMFLRRKPEQASLLDLFGPWPVYIAVAAVLALAMFAVLYALRRPPVPRHAGARQL